MPFDLSSNFKTNLASAKLMVEAFAYSGADKFTIIAERGEKEVLINRKFSDIDITTLNLRSDLEVAEKEKCNLHIRPYSIHNTLIQLDDCNVKEIFPFCVSGSGQVYEEITPFLIIETSPNSFQVWLSFNQKLNEDTIKGIKQIYIADPGATGSCRLAGSKNFKPKHGPNFPTVKIIHSDLIYPLETEILLDVDFPAGVATTQKHRKKKIVDYTINTPGRKDLLSWPFYDRALRMAPLRRDDSGIDRSRADYIWSFTALSWGHSVESTVNKLLLVSEKAKEKSEYEAVQYASETVLSAARSLE